MFPTAPVDSSRRLRLRPQAASYPDKTENVSDSGYDAEDNLEVTNASGQTSALSPESYFTSADNEDSHPAVPEQAEPVARKRARQACDYCRAKKCRARPNARRDANNFSVVESLSVKSVERHTNFVTFLCTVAH